MRTITTCVFVFLVASSAFCAVDFENVNFGFNNGYKSGKWTPLNINVRSQNQPTTFSGKLTVETRNIYTDEPIFRYATPLQLSKTDRKQKTFFIYCPKITFKLYIQLEHSDESDKQLETSISVPHVAHEITPPTSIASKDNLVLVLAPSGDKLQRIIDSKQLDGEGTQTHVKYLPNSRAMPTKWIGYDAVDLVVMREVSLTEKRVLISQQSALLDWIQRGGTLLLSGGSNFQYLKGSFIEHLLPTKLIREETINTIPSSLRRQFGLNAEDKSSKTRAINTFKNIHFQPKQGSHTLLGSDEQIYIAKRNFGSGQIICFSFDYNAPPFSDLKTGKIFWKWLLKTHGKSERLQAERYAPYRQHEEKLHKQFLSKMPTQIPIIKLLSIALPIYLLSFGGFLFYIGKRGKTAQKRNRSYWIGGLIFVLVSVSVVGVTWAVLPKNITTERFSILSIYPERKNAHLESYVSLRTAARTNTSMQLTSSSFIRPLRKKSIAKPPQLSYDSTFQLREISVEPWSPSTYVIEAFIPYDTSKHVLQLENAWQISGQKANYLGAITLGRNNPEPSEAPSRTIQKLPLYDGLSEGQMTYARILQQEGLLQYLLKDVEEQNRKVLIGWTSQLNQMPSAIPIMSKDKNENTIAETFVIMYIEGNDTER